MNANQSISNDQTSKFGLVAENFKKFYWILVLALFIILLIIISIILFIKHHGERHKKTVQRQNAIHRKHIDMKGPLDDTLRTNLFQSKTNERMGIVTDLSSDEKKNDLSGFDLINIPLRRLQL